MATSETKVGKNAFSTAWNEVKPSSTIDEISAARESYKEDAEKRNEDRDAAYEEKKQALKEEREARKAAKEQAKADKEAAKEAKEKAKQEEEIKKQKQKAVEFWYKELVKNFKANHKNPKNQKKSLDPITDGDEQTHHRYTADDIKVLAAYCYTFDGTGVIPQADEKGMIEIHKELNGIDCIVNYVKYDIYIEDICNSAWARSTAITGIENDLDPELLATVRQQGSPISAAFIAGTAANALSTARNATQLITDPEAQKQMLNFLLKAAETTTKKLTNNAMKQLEAAIMSIIDLTPILNIPVDAAKLMLSKIMTPAQVLAQFKNDLNDHYLDDEHDKKTNEKINLLQELIKQKKAELEYLIGDKLNNALTVINKIANAPNQGVDWYISSLNKAEREAEDAISFGIETAMTEVNYFKQKMHDDLADALAEYLVIPTNIVVVNTQRIIIKELAILTKKAIAKAKVLATKIILKLLGKLGA